MEKGKYSYVPPSVVQELNNIKKEEVIFKDAEAFKKMVVYCQKGRQIKKEERRTIL